MFGSKRSFVLRGRTLEFPGFCVTQHLADGLESCYVGQKYYRFWEILLSKHSLCQSKYYFTLYEFLKRRIHALVGKLENRCFCWYPAAILVSLKGTPTRRFYERSFINIGKPFFRISRLWNIAQTWSKAFCIFIFFHFPDSRPSVLNGLHFYFSLRDSANREYSIRVPWPKDVDIQWKIPI